MTDLEIKCELDLCLELLQNEEQSSLIKGTIRHLRRLRLEINERLAHAQKALDEAFED